MDALELGFTLEINVLDLGIKYLLNSYLNIMEYISSKQH